MKETKSKEKLIMSSLERTRLLEHLVYQQFGSAVGEVASILLSRGSLSFPQLSRLTSLSPSIVQSSLLILSIHSLLFHSETEALNGRLLELYELNHSAVERRLRGGMYVEMGSEWEGGRELEEVVKVLWDEGILRREDLYEVVKQRLLEEGRNEDIFEIEQDKKGKKRARISTDEQAQEAAEKLVRKAFAENFISIVTPGSQLSPSSLEIKWEEELRLLIKGIPTTKDLAKVKSDLREKQIEWAAEERERAKGKGGDISGNASDDDAPRRRKKKRRKGEIASDDEEDEQGDVTNGKTFEKIDPPLPEEVFFRLNPERFHIRWRAQLLTEFARDLYNPFVALVLGLVLDIASREVDQMSTPSSRAVSLSEINRAYDALQRDHPSRYLDVSRAFPSSSLPGDDAFPPSKKKSITYILHICEVLAGLDQWGLSTRESFLQQTGEGQHAAWTVNYANLGKEMKRCTVEGIIRDKLGDKELRCWRIMEAKGKLDEKHVARLAFLSVKEAREVLARLSNARLIEPQEVPRSADRAPSRTLYLWYVDFNRTVTSLIAHHYKALANIQAQRFEQLERKRGLVEKRERTDVRENEALLTNRDREDAEELDWKLEALATAEMRIDKQLFVLREFDPDPEI
ncbi:DNA-directed RNA polymerase III subunit C82 [Sporobolomyces salmoneus]|uniref:DNA-directed RNA polymerase III subunit C82 n=1 Tax=Sporobolomyces salmoneus TaxID=183962 RepID=UPI00317DE5D8